MSDLFVFLDESGNLDFTGKGTKYWILSSLMTFRFGKEIQDLYAIRHNLIKQGTDIERFHASEDR